MKWPPPQRSGAEIGEPRGEQAGYLGSLDDEHLLGDGVRTCMHFAHEPEPIHERTLQSLWQDASDHHLRPQSMSPASAGRNPPND